jgi:tripartite-type tricarboxylate transporter receptor subunit TctC
MRLTRRQLHRLAAGTAALAALPCIANAQAYPTRPMRVIGAGAATEILARQIANDLADALGQPIVVENRPGANGYIAWNHMANAEPNGQTLLLAENALAMSQALYKKAASAFDPLTQCDAVAALAASPSALMLSKNAAANTVAELVAYSRTVPGTINYASAGAGSVAHSSFEVFKDAVGMEAIHIPCKGGGQGIVDVAAGHIPMMITSVQTGKSQVESGQLKALAVTRLTPSPAMPGIPTMQEAGVKRLDVDLRFSFTLLGPKGLTDAVKAKLESVATKGDGRPLCARAAGEPRHDGAVRSRSGAANQVRKRDQDLDQVHRREGHQAGIIALIDPHPADAREGPV